MLYSYQKATPDNPHPGQHIPHYLKLLPTIVSALGLGLIATVVWPILSFSVIAVGDLTPSFFSAQLISPVVSESLPSNSNQIRVAPQLAGNVDYTKASNWFSSPSFSPSPIKPQEAKTSTGSIEEFSLSIPSLGIQEARVKINGEDLSQSLVHYPGTALPGEFGSPVIFGHSTLPQFFKADNYMSIFSTLPNLEPGSDIFVTVDGIRYTYRVSQTYQVKPSETQVLLQTFDKKTLKLITCVPPGTKFRRLVVEADLIKT